MMPDREKVIHHLEDAIEASGNGALWRFVRVDIIEDAIALLKTQEPKKRESRAMLPCKCGGVRREHWYGIDCEALVCKRCGFKVIGKNSTDAIRKWNEAVKQE